MEQTKTHITTWFQTLQDDICQQLETADGKGRFKQDIWTRDEGGGGRTRILEGEHIEKGGVLFSAVHGPTPPKILQALNLDEADFYATGVSIVLHPKNPHTPIIHMNVRYFEMSTGVWWFGGGIDLTPHYVVPSQAAFFHQQLKDTCDRHDPYYYPRFKRWADDYFFQKHRNETRGVGGIFFDRLNSEKENKTKDALFSFVQDVGNTFCKAYIPLLEQSMDKPFSEREQNWQFLRRGRYVEFNLVWDKGTKFGLDTGGRTESILMSLPPRAHWEYNFQPETNSPEAYTLSMLKKDVEWLG